jgi:hypothetical protein
LLGTDAAVPVREPNPAINDRQRLRTSVFTLSAEVLVSEGMDLLTYLFASEALLLVVMVLIALALVGRNPHEH